MQLPADIQHYVNNGLITPEQAARLTPVATNALNRDLVRLLLDFRVLTIEHVLAFTPATLLALQNMHISCMVFQSKLTPEQLIGLNDVTAQALGNTGIQSLMSRGRLTLNDVLALNLYSYNALCDQAVVQLVMDGRVTAMHLATITQFRQSVTLHNRVIRALIVDAVITVEQALQLTSPQRQVIENAAIRQRLIEGQITIEDILADRVVLPPPAPEPADAIQLNDAQSTHTASVHRTVSESATRLATEYRHVIQGDALNQTLEKVRAFVNELPNGSLKNEAAKRCIARISAQDYPFADPSSRLSVRELLALVYTAIHDEVRREASLQDACDAFIGGLYEIQRGYNLSESWLDDNQQDRPICGGGAFNKLIEKLISIHPSCHVKVITKNIAGEKLKRLVLEKAVEHVQSQPTVTLELIEQLKNEGMEAIWEFIETAITLLMFDEFGSLYQRLDDPEFIQLIESGNSLDFPPKELEALEARVRATAASVQNPHTLFSVAQQKHEDDAAAPSSPSRNGAAP